MQKKYLFLTRRIGILRCCLGIFLLLIARFSIAEDECDISGAKDIDYKIYAANLTPYTQYFISSGPNTDSGGAWACATGINYTLSPNSFNSSHVAEETNFFQFSAEAADGDDDYTNQVGILILYDSNSNVIAYHFFSYISSITSTGDSTAFGTYPMSSLNDPSMCDSFSVREGYGSWTCNDTINLISNSTVKTTINTQQNTNNSNSQALSYYPASTTRVKAYYANGQFPLYNYSGTGYAGITTTSGSGLFSSSGDYYGAWFLITIADIGYETGSDAFVNNAYFVYNYAGSLSTSMVVSCQNTTNLIDSSVCPQLDATT